MHDQTRTRVEGGRVEQEFLLPLIDYQISKMRMTVGVQDVTKVTQRSYVTLTVSLSKVLVQLFRNGKNLTGAHESQRSNKSKSLKTR